MLQSIDKKKQKIIDNLKKNKVIATLTEFSKPLKHVNSDNSISHITTPNTKKCKELLDLLFKLEEKPKIEVTSKE